MQSQCCAGCFASHLLPCPVTVGDVPATDGIFEGAGWLLWLDCSSVKGQMTQAFPVHAVQCFTCKCLSHWIMVWRQMQMSAGKLTWRVPHQHANRHSSRTTIFGQACEVYCGLSSLNIDVNLHQRAPRGTMSRRTWLALGVALCMATVPLANAEAVGGSVNLLQLAQVRTMHDMVGSTPRAPPHMSLLGAKTHWMILYEYPRLWTRLLLVGVCRTAWRHAH